MTPLTINDRIGDLTAHSPQCVRLLTGFGVDVERDADKTLCEVCEKLGLDGHTVVDLLCRCENPLPRVCDWPHGPESSMTELVDRIIAIHHEYLRRELPRLKLLIDRAIRVEGEGQLNLEHIRMLYQSVQPELEEHMAMEEQVLFPLIRELEWAVQHRGCYSGGVGRPIAESQHSHDEYETTANVLRKLTRDFATPDNTSDAYRALMESLADLAADMKEHSRLEIEVLLPRAIAAEAGLTSDSELPAKATTTTNQIIVTVPPESHQNLDQGQPQMTGVAVQPINPSRS